MASLRILVPDATTNYIKNPSFRYDTTGWIAAGSTITRTLDRARFGISSLKIVAPGTAIGEGTYYRVNALANIADPITCSIYARGAGNVRIRLIDSISGKQFVSAGVALSQDRWQRLSVTGACTGGNDIRVYVETAERAQGVTFYVDGAQMERKAYPTTYCDGDQPGCQWDVVHHGSASRRLANTREGGRWVDVAGCGRASENLYMTAVGGLGMAPLRNNIQPYADAPGSYFQSTKILDRLITLTFHAVSPDRRRKKDISLRELHGLRQMLFDIVKPDKTSGGQPFIIEYQDGDWPVYLKVRYDGGLEGEWDIRNRWANSFPLRLLALSPMLWEDSQDVKQVNFRSSATVNYIAQRIDGRWSEMNGGMDGAVYGLQFDDRGRLIACGSFIHANNKATATDPQIFANFIAYWADGQWNRLGTGANGQINAVAVAPNGDIYAAGAFSSIGGVAAAGIARWDASAQTWNAMGSGLGGGAGFAVKVAPNGDVYVGGSFTTAGGVSTTYMARWDGGSWHYVGLYGGLNNYVYALAISDDGGQVYAGGAFTDERTSPAILTLNRVAVYYTDTELFDEMGDGFDNDVLTLIWTRAGRIYAGGRFIESGNATNQTLLHVAYFNGAQWFDMAGGADDVVRALAEGPAGEIMAVGDFTVIGSAGSAHAGLWNGSTWIPVDIEIDASVYACAIDQAGNFYVGAGTIVEFSSVSTLENTGTAEVSPWLYILGPATLRWVENLSAGRRFYADLDILDDEEVTIDFAAGTARSTVRGDLSYAIIAGADFRAWRLLPGDNDLAILMTDDVQAVAQMGFTPSHWSADATEVPDAL